MPERALRILYLLYGLATGGAEISLLRKMQRLRQKGHYAALAYCIKRGESIDHYVREYLQCNEIYQIEDNLLSIQPIVNELRIDVLHAIISHPVFLKRAKEMNHNLVCVLTLTGDLYDRDKRFNHRLYTDAIVTVAQNFHHTVANALIAPPPRIVTIENGVDCAHFQPDSVNRTKAEILNTLGIESNAKIVLQIARIHPIKNIEDSLAIAKTLCGIRADCVFLLAGGHHKNHESYMKDLLAAKDRMGLSGRYFFLGDRSDIAALLTIADCVISSTRAHEGTPNAILEALAAGKPVVALQCDGITDVVLHEETGFIAASVEEAGRYIHMVLEDDRLKEKFGAAARQYAEERFALDDCVSRYEKLYCELLDAPLNTARRRWSIRANRAKDAALQKVFSFLPERG